nr:UvrD-helicase domain-containing protein [Halomicroarcula laminariae]
MVIYSESRTKGQGLSGETKAKCVGVAPVSENIPQLEGAQARIREAFLNHESGLFTLACTAGFGKSTTAEQIAAEGLATAADAGTPHPEDCLAVVSFSRDDAASIEPGLDAVLTAFADDNLTTEQSLDDQTANRLQRGLRQSEYIGTIDSVLRSVFEGVTTEVGFDEMPTVGNEALLASLRRDSLEELRKEPEYAGLFEQLEDAYGESTRVDDLLEAGRKAKRERRLSEGAFRDQLTDTVDDIYPEGPPSTLTDIRNDIRRSYNDTAADAFEPAESPEAAVHRDQECHDHWRDCISAFTSLVVAYERVYDSTCRDRGVIGHSDVAYWIATFFDTATGDQRGADHTVDETVRERIRQRHAKHFQTLVVDEAQDISVVQHDALGELVPDDARVLLAGDTNQCIYSWRNARPDLFSQACTQGHYFNRDWRVHEREQAAKTYRMRPDITAAVDTVFTDVFTDAQRGAVETLETDYPLVTTDRDGNQTPSVHVAGYHANGIPGSDKWFETGEADTLANYLHSAIATAEFDTQGSTTEITVLFPRRSNMDLLERELQARGLAVSNASQQLFATPLVELICAVVDWLVNPFDPDRTRALFEDEACAFLRATPPADSPLETAPKEVVSNHDFQFEAVSDKTEFIPAVESFIGGLRALATRQARHASDPGELVLEDIIETLNLRTDPLGLVEDEERCLAIIDALLDHVGEWEGTDRYSLEDLSAVFDEYRREPKHGPAVPVVNTADYDIVFRTIHNMKGDEADVVCLADISKPVGAYGPHGEVFLDHTETVALAPPETEARIQVEQDTQGDQTESTPLRWIANRWVDDHLAGAPSLQEAGIAHRADRWRLLYVALTRARDHLVLSLPHEQASGSQAPRNSWVGTLQHALELERAPQQGSYELTVQRPDGQRPLTVGVNDVPFDPPPMSTASQPVPRASVSPPPVQTRRTPRFISGSTLAPLQTAFDRHWLPYLQGRALHTEQPDPDSELELPFDAVGPETVGTIAHDVLTAAISLDISTEHLRACSGPLEQALVASVADHAAKASLSERAAIRDFVGNTVCPQFAATTTWTRLQASSAQFIEEPVDAVANVAGIKVEAHNHVDIVSVTPDGTWHVDDLKIALTEPGEALRSRHKRQVGLYVWALRQQLPGDTNPEVSGTLTYLGTKSLTHNLTVSEDDIRESLEQLRSR